jgi:hypothetical protein
MIPERQRGFADHQVALILSGGRNRYNLSTVAANHGRYHTGGSCVLYPCACTR